MKHAVIYFGNDLPVEQKLDLPIRKQKLDEGVQLLSKLPGVEIKSQLPLACAVIVDIAESALLGVRETLDRTHTGTMSVDDPNRSAFRTAR